MTDEMMALRSMREKDTDAELLREMIGFAAERLMELEVAELTGAVELHIPKLRKSSCFSGFLEPRQMLDRLVNWCAVDKACLLLPP